jgi:hypothetical protein
VGAFAVNLFLWGCAWLLLITLFGAFLSPLPYMLALGHAMFNYRRELMSQHAEELATKMAEKMRGASAAS